MITKLIATFPCGNKRIRSNDGASVYFKGIKLSGSRPHLIQVFGRDFNDQEKDFIYHESKMVTHPYKGLVTLNGEFISTVKI